MLEKLISWSRIRDFIAFVFILTMFFSVAINNIAYAILLVFSLYYFFKHRMLKINYAYLPIIATFVYAIFDILVFGDTYSDYKSILRYLIIIGSPLIFLGDKLAKYRFKLAFLCAHLIFLLIIYYGAILNFIEFKAFNFYTTGENINKYIFLPRLYYGLSSMIAGVFIFNVFKQPWKKYLFFIIVLISNLIISSRLSSIILSFILILELYMDLKNNLSFKKILWLCLGTVCIALILFNNPGIKERLFLNINSTSEFIEEIKIKEPRFAIWRCALQIDNAPGFNTLTGYADRESLYQELYACYNETIYIKDKREWFLKVKYNTHNQFLLFYLLHGWLGIGLLAVTVLYLFLKNRRNRMNMYLILVIISFFSIENVFARQVGTYLIAICFGLILFNIRENSRILHPS